MIPTPLLANYYPNAAICRLLFDERTIPIQDQVLASDSVDLHALLKDPSQYQSAGSYIHSDVIVDIGMLLINGARHSYHS